MLQSNSPTPRTRRDSAGVPWARASLCGTRQLSRAWLLLLPLLPLRLWLALQRRPAEHSDFLPRRLRLSLARAVGAGTRKDAEGKRADGLAIHKSPSTSYSFVEIRLEDCRIPTFFFLVRPDGWERSSPDLRSVLPIGCGMITHHQTR